MTTEEGHCFGEHLRRRDLLRTQGRLQEAGAGYREKIVKQQGVYTCRPKPSVNPAWTVPAIQVRQWFFVIAFPRTWQLTNGQHLRDVVTHLAVCLGGRRLAAQTGCTPTSAEGGPLATRDEGGSLAARGVST